MFTGTLFSNDIPCLRRLHLHRCLVNLSSPTLSNLMELSVANITFGVPMIDAWLNILGNMSFLCWLSIAGAISGLFPTCPLPNPHLPNLSCLTIDGDFRDCMALINHITHPPLHVLRLTFVDVTSGPTLKDLLSMIERRLSLWSPPAKAEHQFIFQCLNCTEMLIGNSMQLGGTWSVSKSKAADDTSLQYPVMSIHLVFVNSEEMESSVPPFLLSFDHLLMGVSSLIFWLDSSTQHMFGLFLEVLHIFNNVEGINLVNNSLITILPLLQTTRSIGEDVPPVNYLPSLQRVLLQGIDFDHGGGLAFDTLVSFVQHQQRVLAPIETVMFSTSHINLI